MLVTLLLLLLFVVLQIFKIKIKFLMSDMVILSYLIEKYRKDNIMPHPKIILWSI